MAGKHQTKFRAGQTVWIPMWLDIGGENETGCARPIRVTNEFVAHDLCNGGGCWHRVSFPLWTLRQMVKRRLTLSSSCSIYPSKRLAERYFKLRGVKVVNF